MIECSICDKPVDWPFDVESGKEFVILCHKCKKSQLIARLLSILMARVSC